MLSLLHLQKPPVDKYSHILHLLFTIALACIINKHLILLKALIPKVYDKCIK